METKPTYITRATPIVAVDNVHLHILQQVANGDLDPLDAAKALGAYQVRVIERTLLGIATDTVLLPDIPTIIWLGMVRK